MKDIVDKCSTKGCAIDIGTIIENDDFTSLIERIFPTENAAELAIAEIKKLASAAAFDEDAEVVYQIQNVGNEAKLDASVTFSCQAEKIIFELSLRSAF
ncbi:MULTISPECIES: DUF406 domain-containing protein [Enterobacteriaceae]|uniref:DUF406 domain-containing protein n=1 Tax=Enterobacteriaceae TaxID=543 RepID=UPI00226B60D6|nr:MULTISPECIES: DUF406 domain-containing protein [Enterobacteriaceae]MCX9044107.1 DUF406 domain-containing protein [Citrobacter portucalensis]MDA8491323.1 DUF406 domain-containing protein [Kluyvera sp. Awk 3]